VALIVPVESSQTVAVHTNAPEPSPAPLSPAVKTVIVFVAMDQVPVRANCMPSGTIPAAVDAQTVQVATDPSVTSPEPSVWHVVVVSLPEVPVRTDPAPVALIIAVKRPVSVEVVSNASESAPTPLCAAVMRVIVVIPAIQMPVASHNMPT